MPRFVKNAGDYEVSDVTLQRMGQDNGITSSFFLFWRSVPRPGSSQLVAVVKMDGHL
jgi:hypothetical protein